MRRTLLVIVGLIFSLLSYGIDVKISNPRLDLDAKDNSGEGMISAHCKLNVKGIKGRDFDLVAIVKDDTGEWHNDRNGNPVKTHYKCNATYEDSEWKDIQVYLRHKKLAPKPGKHTYKVYLYVYYNGEWYNGTYAGSYDLEGPSSSTGSKSSGSSGSRSSSGGNTSNRASSSQKTSKTTKCGVCSGSGIITCLLCAGAGGTQQWRCLTYPPYSSYYVWVNCIACGGGGKVTCNWCSGRGEVEIVTNNNSNNYNYNYNGGYVPNYNYNSGGSSSSSSSSSVYTTCRICGGSGVCTSCHGSGGEWRDTGYYTGSGSKSWIDCPSCRGNKKCFNCYGTGKQ
ncbi:MAG: hypothetical protein J1F38_10510 [Muribaculaceae bacterium]|nr:hypothetical protein [Muribaculaceae bacterium]